MIKYIKREIKKWRFNRELKEAKENAHIFSEKYNNKQIIIHPNVGLRMVADNGKILLLPIKNYIYMNREGFKLARRRGMFTKDKMWTDAVNSCIYSTLK